ncbi:MAG: hypothetical protein L7G91_02730 [Acidilobus sp.]|nr:hypothetical protein [Acidilobus sp.]MCG2889525.1 hypothetical protein [Acidilobus sp.]MCG2891080.1 hypothetical protein [Acidilobus sp.]
MKALSSESRLTANMLVLELSTMIVAIALAFNAESLEASRLTWASLVNFVIVNIVVIWFWWRYVVERLGNPPRRSEFPVLDVIILILISVLPVVLRTGDLTYIAGVLAAIAFSWSGMVWGSLRDLALPAEVRGDLRREMTARLAVGSLFAASAALYGVGAHLLSQAIFIVTIAVIAYRVLVGYAARLHRRRLLGQS